MTTLLVAAAMSTQWQPLHDLGAPMRKYVRTVPEPLVVLLCKKQSRCARKGGQHKLVICTASAPKTSWQPVTLSWYSGGTTTADGTRMHNAGKWAATYRAPLGAVLEVRVGDKVQTLVVRDRTAKRYGKRLDLPRDTFKAFGPLGKGLLKGEFRRIK